MPPGYPLEFRNIAAMPARSPSTSRSTRFVATRGPLLITCAQNWSLPQCRWQFGGTNPMDGSLLTTPLHTGRGRSVVA